MSRVALFLPVIFAILVVYPLFFGVCWVLARGTLPGRDSRSTFSLRVLSFRHVRPPAVLLFSWGAKWRWWRRVELTIVARTGERIYELCVGRDRMRLRLKELEDTAEVFFRLMGRTDWRFFDGLIRVRGGSFGDRQIRLPLWSSPQIADRVVASTLESVPCVLVS